MTSRVTSRNLYGPDLSWAGLSRAIQKALDGEASAFAAAPAGVPQHSIHGLLANACLDYVPQVHTYNEMQQRLELGRQLAQIDGGALLTRTGDGHTSIYTSDCARSAAEAFLVERGGEANRICES